MKCSRCNQENPEDALYCMRCGKKLAEGASSGTRDRTAFAAPDPLSYMPRHLAEKIRVSHSALEGELKRVTVLFCDIVDSTGLAERVGPEPMHALLNRFFEVAMKEVHRYEGTINQFLGDGFMALFGAPVAHEDHPRRAVKAALSIQRAIQQSAFDRKGRQEVNLETRIGINTGQVVLGTIGDNLRMDYTAIGDTSNLAARLQQEAEPGTVYLSEDTYKAVKEYFDCEPLGALRVKGKSEPVMAFKALYEKIHLDAARRMYSEMLGREKELDELKMHLCRLLDGQGGIVSIIGEAGIGKSRLVAEWRQFIDLIKVAALEGRALSMGKNLSYYPIIDVLKNWAGIAAEDTEPVAHAKLERAIRRIYPEGLPEVFPFVATLMGMKLNGKYAKRVKGIEGKAMEKLIMKNLRDLLMHGSARQPVVYIFQDLHWADLSSIELLESLYRVAETHPVLFINVLRPDYPETSDRLLHTLRNRYPEIHTEITLQPLDDAQCRKLIQNLLKTSGLPGNIAAQITGRAEGNPYFIEEVVLSLVDEGAIERHNGYFEITEKIDSVVVPMTIQDVLMARIDRLEEPTKQLLKNAAVIGRYFFYKILNEVAKDIEDFDGRLDYLLDTQLILESGRTEGPEFLFKNILAQEVTYESILLEKRKELHLKVAKAIESMFKERLHEFYGMLTLHYSKGENLDKAEEYLIKAGKEAMKSAASSEALNYFQEALKIYLNKFGKSADPDKAAELEKNIALAYFNKGLMAEAVGHFDRVFEYWGEKTGRNKIARVFELIWTLLNIIWHLYIPGKRKRRVPTLRENEVIKLLEKRANALVAVDTTRMFFDSVSVLRKLNNLDITQTDKGPEIFAGGSILFSITGISLGLAEKIFLSAEQVLGISTLSLASNFHYYKKIHDFVTGNWKAFPLKDEVVEAHLSTGEIYSAGGYLVWCGLQYLEKGEFSMMDKCLDQLKSITDMYDNDTAFGRYYVLKTRFLLRKRNLEAALETADIGTQFLRGRNLNLYSLWVSGNKAYLQVLLGDMQGARDSLDIAIQDRGREKINLPAYLSGLLISQCLLHLTELENSVNLGEDKKFSPLRKSAFRACRTAVKNALKYAADKTEAFKLMGVYYWLTGKQKKALRWWDKSIRIGERLGARPELARTYFETGKRLLEPKSKRRELNGISAEAYLDKAKALFEDMDLEWDLEELGKFTCCLWNRV